jgi:quercetin dioxygenase-like cupin family protein
MRRWSLSICFLLSTLIPLAMAQDPVIVDPKIAKVEFENDRIRVLRVHYQAHQKLAMHQHPAKIAVCLTKFHMRRTAADGSSTEATCEFGTVTWREPEKHAVENLDDTDAETIEIELKYAIAPAAVQVGGIIPLDPSQIELEPHRHVLFKNQYVEVMDVQIDPGDVTSFHRHALDTIFVGLSDSPTQSQLQGGDWEPASPSKIGLTVLDEDSKKPFTHRIKNVGTAPYRVLCVELLP